MATQFVTTTLSTTQFIADTQEIFVSTTGAILSTGPGIASFDGLANNIDVFVHGTVVASWRGIDLVGTSTGRSGGTGDHSVFVGEAGIVQTTATAGIAVNLEGSYNTVSNLGLISSDGSALYFYNGHGHIVQNHGTILSTGDLAIRFLAINSIAQGEGLNFIHNSGLVEGVVSRSW